MTAAWCAVEPARGVRLHLAATDAGLLRLFMNVDEAQFLRLLKKRHGDFEWRRGPQHPVLSAAARQLSEYFSGERRSFDVALDMRGTEFQLRAWAALQKIPYGETRSYAEQARAIGAPNASRAVGAANGANPVGIIVPCHRVIASNGSLCGFGGGLAFKRMLLDLETRHAQQRLFSLDFESDSQPAKT